MDDRPKWVFICGDSKEFQQKSSNTNETYTLRIRCPVSRLISTHAHYIYGLSLSNKPNCLLSGHFESLSPVTRTRLGFLLRLNEFNSPATEVEQVIRSHFGSNLTCRPLQELRPNPRNLSAAERVFFYKESAFWSAVFTSQDRSNESELHNML